jgi:hypothetical protein
MPDILLKQDGADGKTNKVRPTDFTPLTLDDLSSLLDDPKSSIDIAYRGEWYDITEKNCHEKINGTMSVVFDKPPRPFALVRGGWLPMPFVIPPQFFVDRNVVSKLKSLTSSNPRPSEADFSSWMQTLLQGRPLFNPLPYAWESANRRRPTFSEFEQELVKARQEILHAFPNATVSSFEAKSTAAAYHQLIEFVEREQRQTQFLLNVAPNLVDTVADSKIEQTKQRIFAAALAHGVPRRGILMFAVMSTLFESNREMSIGRSLLKPKPNYNVADAYNAISDLRAIELLVGSHAMAPTHPPALATDDIALVKFWCALGLRAKMPITGGWKFSYSFSNLLFARLDSKQIASLNAELNV